jgi:thiazole synthase ThiGH ThiG subunit
VAKFVQVTIVLRKITIVSRLTTKHLEQFDWLKATPLPNTTDSKLGIYTTKAWTRTARLKKLETKIEKLLDKALTTMLNCEAWSDKGFDIVGD